MEILEKIKKELAIFEEKRSSLLKELKADFGPMLKPLFEEYPEVENISWTQYTPYFNDGDECTFCCHVYDLKINGDDEYDMDEKFKEAWEEFTSILTSIPDDFYKDLFGDHMEITINSDCSVETEEYEHD